MSPGRWARGAAHTVRVIAAVLADAYVRPLPRASDGPLVTVVIAAYNRGDVLRYAIASAVRQTYRRLEILVIGDACTDDSEQVVAAASDPRVRWINLEQNSGSQAGPNQRGLEVACGELIAYLGQDDVWRSDHVAVLVADLQRTGADASCTVVDAIWPRPVPVRRFGSPVPGAFTPPSCLMHTRAAGLAAGWRGHRETVRPPDDEFYARMRATGARFSRARALTVVKFASALRPGSYVRRGASEQAAALSRIERRGFVAREALLALLLVPFRPRYGAYPKVSQRMAATPGGVVAEFRRIRGLDPRA